MTTPAISLGPLLGRLLTTPTPCGSSTLETLFTKFAQPPSRYVPSKIASYSLFKLPLGEQGGLRGNSRLWGDASPQVQGEVMQAILRAAGALSFYDQATLLATARLESGFNPDAAAASTSAAGVFQLTKKTAASLGVYGGAVFDTEANAEAAVKLLLSNRRLDTQSYAGLTASQRAELDYAYHHDGPSLAYGGLELAQAEITPYIPQFLELVQSFWNSDCAANMYGSATF